MKTDKISQATGSVSGKKQTKTEREGEWERERRYEWVTVCVKNGNNTIVAYMINKNKRKLITVCQSIWKCGEH